ncbi:sensor histidine kinase [Rhizobacter fulvus]
MDLLPRFRRTRSWIEAYGLDVALAVTLIVGVVLQQRLSAWIRGAAAPATIGLDLLLGIRGYLGGLLPAVTLVFAARPLLAARGPARWLVLAAVVLGASVAGCALMLLFQGLACGCETPAMTSFAGLARLHQVLVITATVAGVHEFVRARQRAADALHAEQLERVELDGRLAAGQLQVLLAQIEPHFLFNSLANLRRLLRTDSAAGLAMLADLKRYLEVALPRMRAAQSTLGREAELVRAFLAVHQVRMGARLQVEVDVPAPLETRPMPPMMLLTLVENALKHGLNPLPEGGAIRLSASAAAGRLQISVADTGRGLVPGSGGGTGLANIRGRLRAAYGAAASLSLQLNQPRGVIATIVLPELAG